jgi:hypothetical protein
MADRESWERLASEFASRAEETKSLAVRWSPDLGYDFIDVLRDQADPGAVQELKTLAAETRALFQQDGMREPWVILLDATRKFDQTVKIASHSSLYLPKRNILPALAGAASRQSVGAIPGCVKFEPTPARLRAPQFRRFPFCRFEREFPFRRYQDSDLDLLPVEGEEFMYVAHFDAVQIGTPEPANHRLFRVIARYCLHRRSEMRQPATAPITAAEPAAAPLTLIAVTNVAVSATLVPAPEAPPQPEPVTAPVAGAPPTPEPVSAANALSIAAPEPSAAPAAPAATPPVEISPGAILEEPERPVSSTAEIPVPAPPNEEASASAPQATEDTASVESSAIDNRAIVDAFIGKVLAEKGTRITRKNIYNVAGYRDQTGFLNFQRGECPPALRNKFMGILTLPPEEFLKRLEAYESKTAR